MSMDDGGFAKREGREMRPLPPATVRFWEWVGAGWVKLTLSEGQELAWCRRERHEEGWSRDWAVWHYHEGVVYRTSGTDGTDCDGRHSSMSEDVCPAAALASVQAVEHHDFQSDLGEWVERREPIPDGLGGVIWRPSWRAASRSQRDYTAEAAGY